MTLNLSMCADRSIIIKKSKNKEYNNNNKNMVSYVTRQVSPVTCHKSLRQQPQPRTLAMLTPPLCTAGWFAMTQIYPFPAR